MHVLAYELTQRKLCKTGTTLGVHAGRMHAPYDCMQAAYEYDRRRPTYRRQHPAFYGVDTGMQLIKVCRE